MTYVLKNLNESRILELLLKNGPMSRAEMARNLSVMRSTTGRIASDLLDAGMLRESSPSAGIVSDRGIGRPGELLEINSDYACFIGAEIGVGYVRAVLADFACGFRKSAKVELADHSPGIKARALRDMIPGLIADAGYAAEQCKGICVAVPGIVNNDGFVIRAPNIGWYNVPFLEILSQELVGIPALSLENDANAFAVSYLHSSGDSAFRNGLFVWIEAGIGGGLLRDGELLRGENGLAGEIGHIMTGVDHPALDRPIVNHWEEVAGRVALLEFSGRLGGCTDSLEAFIAALKEGGKPESVAAEIWVEAFSNGIAALNSVLDPGEIVIGGPGAVIFSALRDQVESTLSKRLVTGTPLPNFHVSSTGAQASAQGCAVLEYQRFINSRA